MCLIVRLHVVAVIGSKLLKTSAVFKPIPEEAEPGGIVGDLLIIVKVQFLFRLHFLSVFLSLSAPWWSSSQASFSWELCFTFSPRVLGVFGPPPPPPPPGFRSLLPVFYILILTLLWAAAPDKFL